MSKSVVSVVKCSEYEPDAVRRAVRDVLAPLGGMERFVRPGMKVLLKPNLLSDAPLERAVTTHPALLQAVAERVGAAGGTLWIGDSPAGPTEDNARIYRRSGTAEVAERLGASLLTFDGVTWKRLNGMDYFIARPALEADLLIDLPKLKTHNMTLYTGAVKNLFGVIPGQRKRELHLHAPGVHAFSEILADVLELARPGLVLMDGIVGQEGNGPGAGGTPHPYGCLAASTDAVALDAAIVQAMGYRAGQVVHLTRSGARGLGTADPDGIEIVGDRSALDWGRLRLPQTHWYLNLPSWMAAPAQRWVHIRPQLNRAACIGCGRCVEVCPAKAITRGHPPTFDLRRCVGCLCCTEVCPQAALSVHESWLARLAGMGK